MVEVAKVLLALTVIGWDAGRAWQAFRTRTALPRRGPGIREASGSPAVERTLEG
ncbi:hypothetical protein [Sphaerisporangium dianthi]|uniref:Uncharacterized protein n=1 Tax=Sphaerisporangium dianthi TaxID=1436120 RepID=A0ABV9CWX4_9ACTN